MPQRKGADLAAILARADNMHDPANQREVCAVLGVRWTELNWWLTREWFPNATYDNPTGYWSIPKADVLDFAQRMPEALDAWNARNASRQRLSSHVTGLASRDGQELDDNQLQQQVVDPETAAAYAETVQRRIWNRETIEIRAKYIAEAVGPDAEGAKVSDYLVQSPGLDPYFVGSRLDHLAADWIVKYWPQCGYPPPDQPAPEFWHGKKFIRIHDRAAHYALRNLHIKIPNGAGKGYGGLDYSVENNDKASLYGQYAIRVARYLGKLHPSLVADHKNPEPKGEVKPDPRTGSVALWTRTASLAETEMPAPKPASGPKPKSKPAPKPTREWQPSLDLKASFSDLDMPAMPDMPLEPWLPEMDDLAEAPDLPETAPVRADEARARKEDDNEPPPELPQWAAPARPAAPSDYPEMPEPGMLGEYRVSDDYKGARRYYTEVFVEKSTMDNVLTPWCEDHNALLMTFTGHVTTTTGYDAIMRAVDRAIAERKEEVLILYVSDFDYSGIEMPGAAANKIDFWRYKELERQKADEEQGIIWTYTVPKVHLVKVALTIEQVREFELLDEPIPAERRTGPEANKFKNWQKNYKKTDGSPYGFVELDALEGKQMGLLHELLDRAVRPFFEDDEALERRTEEARQRLIEKLEEVRNAVLENRREDLDAARTGLDDAIKEAIALQDEVREQAQRREDKATEWVRKLRQKARSRAWTLRHEAQVAADKRQQEAFKRARSLRTVPLAEAKKVREDAWAKSQRIQRPYRRRASVLIRRAAKLIRSGNARALKVLEPAQDRVDVLETAAREETEPGLSEAQRAAEKTLAEAQERADKIMPSYRERVDKLVTTTQEKSDRTVREADEHAERIARDGWEGVVEVAATVGEDLEFGLQDVGAYKYRMVGEYAPPWSPDAPPDDPATVLYSSDREHWEQVKFLKKYAQDHGVESVESGEGEGGAVAE